MERNCVRGISTQKKIQPIAEALDTARLEIPGL